jgi:hypothetical protein
MHLLIVIDLSKGEGKGWREERGEKASVGKRGKIEKEGIKGACQFPINTNWGK